MTEKSRGGAGGVEDAESTYGYHLGPVRKGYRLKPTPVKKKGGE